MTCRYSEKVDRVFLRKPWLYIIYHIMSHYNVIFILLVLTDPNLRTAFACLYLLRVYTCSRTHF